MLEGRDQARALGGIGRADSPHEQGWLGEAMTFLFLLTWGTEGFLSYCVFPGALAGFQGALSSSHWGLKPIAACFR